MRGSRVRACGAAAAGVSVVDVAVIVVVAAETIAEIAVEIVVDVARNNLI
jgi:hypothetical protein